MPADPNDAREIARLYAAMRSAESEATWPQEIEPPVEPVDHIKPLIAWGLWGLLVLLYAFTAYVRYWAPNR